MNKVKIDKTLRGINTVETKEMTDFDLSKKIKSMRGITSFGGSYFVREIHGRLKGEFTTVYTAKNKISHTVLTVY